MTNFICDNILTMNNEIKRFDLDTEHYCVIGYDEQVDSPRNWGNYSKLCIREHRRHSFPNELKLDLDEDNTETLKGYYVFPLDCYEHSGIYFSLSGEGMQCRFDTSCGAGIFCYPTEVEGHPVTLEEAKSIITSELNIYNQYLNWEVYWIQVFKRIPPVTVNGRIYTASDETVDSIWDIWNLKDWAELLDEKFREVYLANI